MNWLFNRNGQAQLLVYDDRIIIVALILDGMKMVFFMTPIIVFSLSLEMPLNTFRLYQVLEVLRGHQVSLENRASLASPVALADRDMVAGLIAL